MHVFDTRLWGKMRRKRSQKEKLIRNTPNGLGLMTNSRSKVFSGVKQLHAKGLYPRIDVTSEHLTTTDITKHFGNVDKFKITNPILPLEKKTKLERLYWRVYGTCHITNNDIMAWLVKGWITKCNGHKINWTKVTTCIAKKKARRSTMNNSGKALKMERLELNEGSERSQGALATRVIYANLGNAFAP